MRRWVLVGVLGATMWIAGCSSSSTNAPTATTAAPLAPCDAIHRLDALGSGGSPNSAIKLDELRNQIAGLKQIRAAVPANVGAAIDTINGALEPLVEAGTDPVPFDQFVKVATDPQVAAASTVVTEYARTSCGVDAGTNGTISGGNGGNASQANGASDPGGASENEASITGAQAYVKSQGGDAAWVTTLADSATWQYKANGNSFDWDVQLSDAAGGTPTLAPADAVLACKALAEYLAPRQAGVTITFKDLDGKTLATNERNGTCAAA